MQTDHRTTPLRGIPKSLLRIAAVVLAWPLLAPAAGIDPTQPGLSGAWYNASAQDQFVVLQVLPASTGAATVAGGWFTFADFVVEDSRSQRWLTLQGSADRTTGEATLQIFRSLDGEQGTGTPVTTRRAGSASIAFADCTHATLRYAFDADASRSAEIRLQRKHAGAACSDGGAATTRGSEALAGVWYDPARSGQGIFLDLDAAHGMLSGGWATYMTAGNPQVEGEWRQRWYSLRASIVDPAAIDGIAIYASAGATFADTSPPATIRLVGVATLTIADCGRATLDYRFTAGENAGLVGRYFLHHLGDDASCGDDALRMRGHVDVPAGVTAAELTVLGASSETGVNAHGDFLLPRAGAAPRVSGVVHSSYGAVQFGIVDPTAATLSFDAHSSAVALLFQAVGAEVLTTDQRRNAIALIAGDPGTAKLTAVITAEQAKDPFVMDHLSAPILDAIAAVVRGWLPPASVTDALRSVARAVRAVARPLAATADAPTDPLAPQQLLITGDASRAGFTVLLGDDNASVVIQNTKRRPAAARVFVTGYTDNDGNHIDLPRVEEQGEKLPVPATRRLSTFSAFGSIGSLLQAAIAGRDVATGTIPWSPIESGRIPLTARDGAVTTDIDVLVLTATWNGTQPNFSANYIPFAAVLQDDLFLLRAKQVFDATVMALLENLGIGGGAVADLPENAVRDLVLHSAERPDFDVILAGLRSGRSFNEVFRGLISWLEPAQLEEMFEVETYVAAVREYIRQNDVADTTDFLEREHFLEQRAVAVASDSRAKLLNASKRALFAVSAVLAGIDTLAQGVDQVNGDDQANFFHLKIVRPTVRIDPAQSEISLGDTLKIKATVRGFEDDPNLYYSWILDSADQSVLDDLHGNRVAGSGSFDSTAHEVSFISGNLITRTDVPHGVTVQVYFKNKSGAYELFGQAKAQITFSGYEIALSPDEVTMRHDQQRTFNIGISPFPDAATLAALRYEWSADTNGRCGTLTSAGNSNSAAQPVVTTTSAHATYAADASNPPNCFADIVHVNLFTMTDGVRKDLGSAEATVVFSDFDIVFAPVADVQIGSPATIVATLSPVPSPDATVNWTWTVSGDGTAQSQNDTGVVGSAIVFRAGATTGTATVTVAAQVTLANGLVENLGTKTRQVRVVNNLVTPVTSGAVQYYTTDMCSVAYVELPRIAGANYYRFTQVTGLGTLGEGPPNNTGGTTVLQPPYTIAAGNSYEVLDTPVAVSCASQPSYTLVGTATMVRVVIARELIIDGAPTPSWTAAWEALFRAAYGSAVIQAEAFHSDITL